MQAGPATLASAVHGALKCTTELQCFTNLFFLNRIPTKLSVPDETIGTWKTFPIIIVLKSHNYV